MIAALDARLHALTHRTPDVLIPLLARRGDSRHLLVFTSAHAAREHAAALPDLIAGAWSVTSIEADDWRGKEELFRAAAVAGAVRLDLDPDLDLRTPHSLPLATGVAYASSHKKMTACL